MAGGGSVAVCDDARSAPRRQNLWRSGAHEEAVSILVDDPVRRPSLTAPNLTASQISIPGRKGVRELSRFRVLAPSTPRS